MTSRQLWTTLAVSAMFVATASAQPPAPPEPLTDKLFVLENLPPLAAMGAKIDIIGGAGGVPGPVVEDKPYSARSLTESTQVLADGNRITQRNEAVIYRDGEGRTRREQTLSGIGPWQAGEPVTVINIHDPVADKTYIVDPNARIAREMRPFQMAIAHATEGQAPARAEVGATWSVPVPPPAPASVPAPGIGFRAERRLTVTRGDGAGEDDVRIFTSGPVGTVAVFPRGAPVAPESVEDLGEQVLEGLLVRGTRTTDSIAAGTIGNERPIDVVTERWYSKDIDAIVLQRFVDPRFGETTYRLVNVVRGEPSADLFQVPQGYEVVAPEEVFGPGVRVMPGTPLEPIELGVRREARE